MGSGVSPTPAFASRTTSRKTPTVSNQVIRPASRRRPAWAANRPASPVRPASQTSQPVRFRLFGYPYTADSTPDSRQTVSQSVKRRPAWAATPASQTSQTKGGIVPLRSATSQAKGGTTPAPPASQSNGRPAWAATRSRSASQSSQTSQPNQPASQIQAIWIPFHGGEYLRH